MLLHTQEKEGLFIPHIFVMPGMPAMAVKKSLRTSKWVHLKILSFPHRRINNKVFMGRGITSTHLPLIPPLFPALLQRLRWLLGILNGEGDEDDASTTIIMQRKLFVELLCYWCCGGWMDVGGFGIIKRELRTTGIGEYYYLRYKSPYLYCVFLVITFVITVVDWTGDDSSGSNAGQIFLVVFLLSI